MTISKPTPPLQGDPLDLNMDGSIPRDAPFFQENEAKELPLTPEEEAKAIEVALAAARKEKYSHAFRANYTASMIPPAFPPTITAEQMLTLFQDRADWHVQNEPKPREKFIIDDNNRRQIWMLCLYFTNDPRAETEYGLDLRANLLLRGNVGCGKTTILKQFYSNPRRSFRVVTCRSISDDFEEYGIGSIRPYYGLLTPKKPTLYWGHDQVGVAFDDLGTENFQAQKMGNNHNPLADIISERCDRGAHTTGLTHITTNLTWAEIKANYQDRVESRLRKFYNDITFPTAAPDWRKKSREDEG